MTHIKKISVCVTNRRCCWRIWAHRLLLRHHLVVVMVYGVFWYRTYYTINI